MSWCVSLCLVNSVGGAQADLLRVTTFAAFNVDLPHILTGGLDCCDGAADGNPGSERLLAVEEQVAFAGARIGQFKVDAGRRGLDAFEFGRTAEDVQVGADDNRLPGMSIQIGESKVLATAGWQRGRGPLALDDAEEAVIPEGPDGITMRRIQPGLGEVQAQWPAAACLGSTRGQPPRRPTDAEPC